MTVRQILITQRISLSNMMQACVQQDQLGFMLIYLLEYHFTSSINKFNHIAQLVMFLGLFCSVLMGISCRGTNFVLGMSKLILETAWAPVQTWMVLLHSVQLQVVWWTFQGLTSQLDLPLQLPISSVTSVNALIRQIYNGQIIKIGKCRMMKLCDSWPKKTGTH